MNILFIAPRFHSNQIDLVKKLTEEGNIVNFLVIRKGQSEDHTLINPILIPLSNKLERLFGVNENKENIFQKAIPNYIKLNKIIKQISPDIIILRNGFSSIYSIFTIPYIVCNRVKVIYYTQGSIYVHKISLLKRIHDFIVCKIFRIKWFTPVLYRGAKKPLIKLKYINFIPFFIYSKQCKQKTIPENGIRFLSVGKYEKRKNLHLIILAAAKLKEMKLKFSITIIGNSEGREYYYEELNNLVIKNGLINEVNLLKNIPIIDMRKYYNNSDVFIMASEKESASISQIEAMSYGLPIICSIDNGTASYVEHNINGFLIKPELEEIKNSLLKYITNKKLVMQHSGESLKLISHNYSIDNNYANFINLVKS